MIQPVQNYKTNQPNQPSFSAIKVDEEELKKRPILLENNLSNRMQISIDKFANAISMYPARGLLGRRNSDFYEFLNMGIVPYLTGSLMLMAVFNGAKNMFVGQEAKASATKLGNKMALGVIFYGIAKSLSKSFVTTPVKWFTGVDTEEPYVQIKYNLPEYFDDADIPECEYHKVLESVEFPRWDVKYGDESKGEPRNIWFDKIAKKIGLGSDLKDSDQDVKPRIKEIAVKTNLAKSISSYMWAAVGVGLAIQDCWDEFFKNATWKFWKGKKFLRTMGSFADGFGNSILSLYNGPKNPKSLLGKYNGKLLLGGAALSTIIGVANVLISRDKPSRTDSSDVIEKDRKYVVN